jgi:hypothetical protein
MTKLLELWANAKDYLFQAEQKLINVKCYDVFMHTQLILT